MPAETNPMLNRASTLSLPARRYRRSSSEHSCLGRKEADGVELAVRVADAVPLLVGVLVRLTVAVPVLLVVTDLLLPTVVEDEAVGVAVADPLALEPTLLVALALVVALPLLVLVPLPLVVLVTDGVADAGGETESEGVVVGSRGANVHTPGTSASELILAGAASQDSCRPPQQERQPFSSTAHVRLTPAAMDLRRTAAEPLMAGSNAAGTAV